jgi:hypothetical protein
MSASIHIGVRFSDPELLNSTIDEYGALVDSGSLSEEEAIDNISALASAMVIFEVGVIRKNED